jgi:hypothetical protein
MKNLTLITLNHSKVMTNINQLQLKGINRLKRTIVLIKHITINKLPWEFLLFRLNASSACSSDFFFQNYYYVKLYLCFFFSIPWQYNAIHIVIQLSCVAIHRDTLDTPTLYHNTFCLKI